MPYRTLATLQDTCAADTGDTPTKAAGCKFLGQSEEATTENDNRAHRALAENDEYLIAQMTHKSFYILDPGGTDTGDDQDCDFSGATALQDALTAHTDDVTLFLRGGAYVLPTGADYLISGANITLIGTGAKDGTTPPVITVDSTYDLDITGDNFKMSGVRVAPSVAAATMKVYFSSCENPDVRSCVIDNMSLDVGTGVAGGVFENIVCGGYDRSLNVFGAQNVVLNSITVRHSSSPGVGVANVTFDGPDHLTVNGLDIEAGTPAVQVGCKIGTNTINQCTFNSMDIYTGDDVALQWTGTFSHSRDVFNGCTFVCGEATAFEIDDDLDLTAVVFHGCEFQSERSLFDSEGSFGAAKDLQLSFRDCTFENTSSVWYVEPVFVFTNSAVRGRCSTLDDCVIKDTRSKNSTAAGDPGVGSGGSQVDLVELEGVAARGITFDRDGVTWAVQDGSWVKITDCAVDTLRILTGTLSNEEWEFSGPGDGLIEVYWSKVTDIFLGPTLRGEWTKPVLYMKGRLYDEDNPDDMNTQCVVDGLQIVNTTASGDWQMVALDVSPLFAYLSDKCTLRHLTFHDDSHLEDWDQGGAGAGGDGLTETLFLIGDDCVLEMCDIHLDCSAYGEVDKIVTMSGQRSVVRNNKFFVEPDTTNFKPDAVIWGTASTIMGCLVEGNIITHSGALSTGVALIEFVNGEDNKVVNNHITIDGAVADSPHDVIDFPTAKSPANYCICMGNTIVVRNAGNAPDINPAAVIGYALNNLINDIAGGITS
jgi:hypothetical protein